MTPYWTDGQATLYHGSALDVLRELPDESVHMCVTSPPYFNLRDYQIEGQIGLEATPDAFVAALVDVFREVRRVLRSDGTLWLNIGDSYASTPPGTARPGASASSTLNGIGSERYRATLDAGHGTKRDTSKIPGVKPKDLIGIPWLLAFALRADGWYLRSEIVWAKRAPMPESVQDRPTSAHEKVFLLSKAPRYYYDAEAVREPLADAREYPTWEARKAKGEPIRRGNVSDSGYVNRGAGMGANPAGRNLRNVWTLGPDPFPGAHFAVFPREIPRRAILAGSREGDVVLDPFCGSGTSLVVAKSLGRRSIGIDLNESYLRDHCIPRLSQQAMFFQEAAS